MTQDKLSEMESVYADIESVTGEKPPNFYTAMAPRGDLAKSVWGMMKRLFFQGTLPPSLTQMIALTISEQADCRYCAVVHQRALQDMGIDQEVVSRYLEDGKAPALLELHAKILDFATKAARNPNDITDADVAELRSSGLSEGELLEVGIAIAFTRFINTWADAARIPLDQPGEAGSKPGEAG